MASFEQVKRYLAHWFQLGRKVKIGTAEELLPKSVLQGDRYSPEFEQCWAQILQSNLEKCYLEGTNQTLSELLQPTWEINPCARCEMPVPILSVGVQPLECPCADLPLWPDTELPQPRSPIGSRDRLADIRDRLAQRK
ncbi:MAG: hypothetical protein KME15_24180 [Drouetiella hepatica Uher 2000/2452]|jgi:hypothetical protein|uniref:Uncharacterized protein n=1 Tax=Drouetiella hepatica Uher 2000/2452 TaxID=904376 RepID=A0A951QFJ4_9CYAN|nr:hypothetical protein [Drouetiella hepatica Uher 2000/2452]